MPQTGPYIHDSDKVWERFFSNEGGGERRFKILISSAFNAGIIGPEINGVVILDEDRRAVVADREFCGNLPKQFELAEALNAAPDWASFSALVRGLERVREPDEFKQFEPDWRSPLPEEENWSFESPVLKPEGDKDPVVFSSHSRKGIIAELLAHSMHRDGYGPWRLAWNVKLRGSFDTSGKLEGYSFDEAHDALWEQHLEKDGEGVFERIISDMRMPYEEGDFMGADELPPVEVGFEGRSAGWLVLDKIEGLGAFSWKSASEMEAGLYELSRDDLFTLYRTVCTLDRNLSKSRLYDSVAHGYAFEREGLREDFDQDFARENGWTEEDGRIFKVAAEGEPIVVSSWAEASRYGREAQSQTLTAANESPAVVQDVRPDDNAPSL